MQSRAIILRQRRRFFLLFLDFTLIPAIAPASVPVPGLYPEIADVIDVGVAVVICPRLI